MINRDTALVRWWRLGPWSSNPLMRRSDRVESVVTLAVMMAVLMLVPLAGAIGTTTYTRLSDQAHIAAASGRQVPAVLLDNPHLPAGESPTRGPAGRDQARARWMVDTAEHTGLVDTGTDVRAGQTVTVWVDGGGNYMQAPRTGTENAFGAVGAALAFAFAGTVGCALVLLAIHGLLGARRRSLWQQEWQTLGQTPGWPVI